MDTPATSPQHLEHLQAIERTYGIKVLLAVVTGSRMWGFAEENSDYDVRFVYRFADPVHYTSFEHIGQNYKDTIHWQTEDRQFDYTGWDLPKYLRHIAAHSMSVVEMTCSPLVLVNAAIDGNPGNFKETMTAHLEGYLNPACLHNAFRGMLLSKKCCGLETVKRALYSARLLLQLASLDRHSEPVSLASCTFLDLLEGSEWGMEDKALMRSLLEAKVKLGQGGEAPAKEIQQTLAKKMNEHRAAANANTDAIPGTSLDVDAKARANLRTILMKVASLF